MLALRPQACGRPRWEVAPRAARLGQKFFWSVPSGIDVVDGQSARERKQRDLLAPLQQGPGG
eukprot:16230571-Heterocapsa_arctica.AAC.1